MLEQVPGPSVLRHHVRQYVAKSPRGKAPKERVNLRDALAPLRRASWPVYLFGGVPRDLMQQGVRARPRDIDIVVAEASVDDIAEAFGHASEVRRNRFGGLRISTHGWIIDAWPVKDTWAFAQRRLPSSGSAEDLPGTTFLNVEAVAVELWPYDERSRRVYHRGFFEAFVTRTVELNFPDNPYPDFAILRSLLVACKLQFQVGPQLAAYVRDHANEGTGAALVALNRAHYPRKVVSPAVISDWLRAVVEAAPGDAIRLPHVVYDEQYGRQGNLFEGQQTVIWPHLSTSRSGGAAGWAY